MLGSHHTLQSQAGPYFIPGTRISWGPADLPGKLWALLPVPLQVQSLQIASLHLVPCVLGGGLLVLSDESTLQSLVQRKHQWSHKPPTVQTEKTRLLQRRNFSSSSPPQLRGPPTTGVEGRERENLPTPGFMPFKAFLEPWHQPLWGLVSGSRRYFPLP